MKLPRRIVDGGAGNWEREVVLSAGLDVPSDQIRRRVAQTLGVSIGAASLTTVTTTAAKSASLGLSLKWLGIGIAVGVLSSQAVSYMARSGAPREVAEVTPNAAQAPHSSTATGARNSPAIASTAHDTAVQTPELAPSFGEAARVRSTLVSARAASAASAEMPNGATRAHAEMPSSTLPMPSAAVPTLAEEMAAIDRVHRALAGGDGRAALTELDRYEATYPSGSFALEAQVLRIDAFTALGDHATARRLAARFLALHPDSPYARRIRSLTNAATNP